MPAVPGDLNCRPIVQSSRDPHPGPPGGRLAPGGSRSSDSRLGDSATQAARTRAGRSRTSRARRRRAVEMAGPVDSAQRLRQPTHRPSSLSQGRTPRLAPARSGTIARLARGGIAAVRTTLLLALAARDRALRAERARSDTLAAQHAPLSNELKRVQESSAEARRVYNVRLQAAVNAGTASLFDGLQQRDDSHALPAFVTAGALSLHWQHRLQGWGTFLIENDRRAEQEGVRGDFHDKIAAVTLGFIFYLFFVNRKSLIIPIINNPFYCHEK